MADVTASVTLIGNPTADFWGVTGQWRNTIHAMRAFNGLILMGSGDAAGNNGGGGAATTIHVYDPATGLISKQGVTGTAPNKTVPTEQIRNIQVLPIGPSGADRLVIPCYDTTGVTEGIRYFWSDDGTTWSSVFTDPTSGSDPPPHTMYLEKFGTTLFVGAPRFATTGVPYFYKDDGAGGLVPNVAAGNTHGYRPTIFTKLGSNFYGWEQFGWFSGSPVGQDAAFKYDTGTGQFANETLSDFATVFPGITQTAQAAIEQSENFPNLNTWFYIGFHIPSWASHDRSVPFGLFKQTSFGTASAITLTHSGNTVIPYVMLQANSKLYCMGSYTSGSDQIIVVLSTSNGSTWSEEFHFTSDTICRAFAYLNGVWYFGKGTAGTTGAASAGALIAYDTLPDITGSGALTGGSGATAASGDVSGDEMASNLSINTAARNAACDAIVDSLDAGNEAAQLRIYSGSVPADVNASLGAATLLAALTMSDPAFGSSSNGVATASAITSDTSADATGTATFCRLGSMNSGTFTPVIQGSVGTSGSDLNLSSTSIISGGTVSVTSLTYTHAAS